MAQGRRRAICLRLPLLLTETHKFYDGLIDRPEHPECLMVQPERFPGTELKQTHAERFATSALQRISALLCVSGWF